MISTQYDPYDDQQNKKKQQKNQQDPLRQSQDLENQQSQNQYGGGYNQNVYPQTYQNQNEFRNIGNINPTNQQIAQGNLQGQKNFLQNIAQQSPSDQTGFQGLDDESVRAGFIRKVYSILSVQLIITVLMCACTMTNKEYLKFQITHIWLFYVALVVNIIVCILMSCFYATLGRKVPINYILLLIFTATEGYMVSIVCVQYDPKIVFMAAFATMAITIALTIYACTTSTDMTIYGGGAFIFMTIALIFGFFLLFTNNKILHIIYACVWCVIYGFYIIYDTQMIIGSGKYQLSIDDYIFAALQLYIDIIGLFLQILEILGQAQN